MTFRHLGNAGRLGNQLHQIAATVGLARARRAEPRFPKWSYQPFFSVPDEMFVNDLHGVDAADLATHIDARTRVYLQDYGLWKDVENEIIEYFRPSKLAWETLTDQADFWVLGRPILSVHVRRGDNVQKNDPGTPNKHLYHPLRPMSYYQEALQRVRATVGSIAVFSDDIEWCKERFDADYFHHGVARPKEHEAAYTTAPVLDWIDLQLMAACDKHIISNSTYAWWGAFLSRNPQPIYPWPWVGPNLHFVDASLMFPPDWIRIEHGAPDAHSA